ncbi:hypothetical protein RSAG8_11568, partial [Rhizoctonia solani AG-8 WAC10335]
MPSIPIGFSIQVFLLCLDLAGGEGNAPACILLNRPCSSWSLHCSRLSPSQRSWITRGRRSSLK